MAKGRVCIIGLDCLTPQLVFDSYIDALPHFASLIAESLHGPLRSSMPPITIPAWLCMATGVDPGGLGLYGFRGRADHSYDRRCIANSLSHQQLPLWTRLSRASLRCRVMGVPGTWPARPIRGKLISGMLTPDGAGDWAHPPELISEIESTSGRPTFDVDDFRTTDHVSLASKIRSMTDEHFDLAEQWVGDDGWEFFMMVELGPDRMHHAFWQYAHSDHRGFVPDHPLAGTIREYYQHLDRRLGAMVAALAPEDLLLVVSDHGAQSMRGAIALNDWLIAGGHLTLHRHATGPQTLSPQMVDWSRTRAWADGGYVGRIYFNIAGREPEGVLRPEEVESFSQELRDELSEVRGVDGERLETSAWRPEELYKTVRGVAPDLTVSLDDLAYRALGSVGHRAVAQAENDRGADGANHARDGILIMRDGGGCRRIEHATLYDIAPTVLCHFGLPIPQEFGGRSLSTAVTRPKALSRSSY